MGEVAAGVAEVCVRLGSAFCVRGKRSELLVLSGPLLSVHSECWVFGLEGS